MVIFITFLLVDHFIVDDEDENIPPPLHVTIEIADQVSRCFPHQVEQFYAKLGM